MPRSLPALVLLACAAGTVPACADVSDKERGAALLKPFKQELQQALSSGLEQGPENAISVCKDQAPAIAARLSTDGIVVGRSSHKLRNPGNTAPAWVTPVLSTYLEAESDFAPVTVKLPDKRVGYVEAIVLQPLCLACHGEELAPGIAARVAAEYPEDAATGFRVGELRGVFWAEFPRD